MIPGDPGVGPVAGTYGTGNCPGAEREEGKDTFSRAEIFSQMEPHAEEYAAQEYSDPSGKCTVCQERREVKKGAGEYKNEQDAGKGVGQALVRRIRDRVRVRAEIRHMSGAHIRRGNWTMSHANVRKVRCFGRVMWISGRRTPVQVPAMTSTMRRGSDRKKELHKIRAHIRASAI